MIRPPYVIESGWAVALGGLLLVTALLPSLAMAAAGCEGTSIRISNLDNLLQTAWEYLTSGAVIRILAAAFFIFGVAALISRRPAAAVAGILAGAVTAFVPSILQTLFSTGTSAISICG